MLNVSEWLILVCLSLTSASLAQNDSVTSDDEDLARIIGGSAARLGQFPYQISYQLGTGSNYQHVCGGAIVAPKWIVTAGHCITERSETSNARIVAGSVTLKQMVPSRTVIDVKRRIVHPDYPGGLHPNDIALLELERPLTFNEYISPISIPKANEEPKAVGILSGWGSTTNGFLPNFPDQLRSVILKIQNYQECVELLRKTRGFSFPFKKTNICTESLGGTENACSGDSGGPLVQYGLLVGVVSWGSLLCKTNIPSVYTKVSDYRDFIEQYVPNLP